MQTLELANTPLQVPKLVPPLRDDTPRVLVEGRDNKEAADGGEMRLEGLGVYFNIVFDLAGKGAELFDGVVWVGCPVSRRGARVGEAVGIRLVASRGWPSDADAGGHGGGGKTRWWKR